MEEIRNAGALEKEIMDDARKRAEKVLRGRERALSDLHDSWTKRTQASLKEMEDAHAANLAAIKLRHEAALPLEKKRAFLTFAEARLREGVHRYFTQLDAKTRDELLVHELGLTGSILGAANVSLRAVGMTTDEAAGLVKRALPDVKITAASAPSSTAALPADGLGVGDYGRGIRHHRNGFHPAHRNGAAPAPPGKTCKRSV